MRPLSLLLAAALVSGILALPAFAQPQDCPTATPWASASLILPHPGESIHPGDIITAESLDGTCYGAVTQGEARTALALHFPTPEDIHRPETVVRIYRDGQPVRTIPTGLLPQRNDILDISPSDSLWLALDSARAAADEIAGLYAAASAAAEQAAGEITTLRDSLATLHATQDAAIAAAVAEAEARHRQELARARAEVQDLTRRMLDAMAVMWRVREAVGAPAMQAE